MSEAASPEALAEMAAALEASGEYKVLRRLTPGAPLPSPPLGAKLGLVLDVETTGADARQHEVIELAMMRFAYTPEGEVLGVHDTFQAYHEPVSPIPPEITALTGIDAAKVAGHRLDLDAVGSFVAPSVIVLAHNAAFDRRFVEKLHPWFSTKAWGCSMAEPPWREEGFEGLKLTYLAAQCGFSTTSTARSTTVWQPWRSCRALSPSPAAPAWRTSSSGRGGRASECGLRMRPSSTRTG